MDKEFEMGANPNDALKELERIKNQLFGYFKGAEVRADDIEDYEKLIFEPVKQALLELKAIKESEPSEALKCIDDIYLNAVFVKKEGQTVFDSHYKLFGESPETHKTISEQCSIIKQFILKVQSQNMKYNEINKTFNDSHICEIKKEFAKYIPLCEESKCDECPLGVGDGVCLKNVFEKKWESQIKTQKQEKVQKVIFEKNVDIRNLKHYIEVYSDDVALKVYNGFHDKDEELTQEEFNSLKEMVKQYEKR